MKKVISALLAIVMVFSLYACTDKKTPTEPVDTTPTTVNIFGLKGPTGMGMAKMIADAKTGKYKDNYNFSIISDPQMIAPALTTGEQDIAACPLNMASTLYNKTKGQVQVLAVNTLGTLYILDRSGTVNSLQDLKGKTVVTSGQGLTPEYALNYLLEKSGLKNDVKVEFKSEHSEVAAAILSGKADVVMLPDPNVTVVTTKDSNVKIAVDITKEIEAASGVKFAMGCIIARKQFVDENPAAVDEFLKNYKASIDYVNTAEDAGQLIADAGIIDNAVMAKKAIPTSKIAFISGDEMKKVVFDNLEILFNADAKSVGGVMPDDNLCYIGK